MKGRIVRTKGRNTDPNGIDLSGLEQEGGRAIVVCPAA
jgi:hypothetical protein